MLAMIPHPTDILKVGLMAFVFIFLANRALRAMGAERFTTRGA